MFESIRGKLVCPFCGKKFSKTSAFVSHVVEAHRKEVEELF